MRTLSKLNIFRRYPLNLIIFETRQDGHRVVVDKGCRIIEKDKSEAYYLKHARTLIRPPPFSCMFSGRKGKTFAFLLSPEKGHFYPLTLNNPTGLEVSSKEMDTWIALQLQKAFTIYPRETTWWEKYAPYIILMFTGVILCFITVFVMRGLGSIAGSVSSITSMLQQASQNFAGAIAPGT